MASDIEQRRLAAILSADAVGYSRLMAADDVAALTTLSAHVREIGALVAAHRGRVVDSPGDNVLAELPSATDGVLCALEIQRVLAARNAALPEPDRLRFRIGVHLGEVLVENERIYGSGVNIAARLEALAPPGGVCVSGAVREQLSGRHELPFHDMGPRKLKNIPHPVHAFTLSSAAPEPVRRDAAPSELPSLAVLPFDNLSGDPDQDYFSEGIAEDLIIDLSALSGLRLIGRHSSFACKGQRRDVREIGRDLGARYIVSGSVRRAQSQVRITADLVDAESGHELWAARYDREITDLFALQDDVRQHIVAALRLRLSGGDRAALERVPTTNLEAYDHLLRARAYRRRFTPENLASIRAHAERAIALDPRCAEAYTLLADVYGAEWIFGLDPETPGIAKVEELAHRALDLDPTSAWAHWTLGMAYRFSGRLGEALAEARTAIALNPNLADAHHLLVTALQALGRNEEAVAAAGEAIRMDPHRWESWSYRASAYFFLDRLEEAERDQERAAALFGGTTFVLLAAIRSERGDLEGARQAARAFLDCHLTTDLNRLLQGICPDPQQQARMRAAVHRTGILDVGTATEGE